ncbi:CoA-acylating methylmalonate-semialdehyde dehydrogenase [Bradyrhizobium canariense]|uniref:methylmalonate-semialdehyde dehydrogenase (CoA acylating) n=1 Tax=Bradyrhizobium canariense TaxID=255045 RepID=A0A1X3FPQ6_9BRAD|nr:CoA-acylating methylmalonate-semialdehyde dehydrogenase [Bradyrhizobium canariense]OSI68655.1 methylmalonate-semialdehyde dehydrogenase (CoA acylating) [Bradyrhizobium canariense]OSI78103.1 methylmalonate-semialdehyde dehydrogenase (CoA acylating) [Bradyrhizobium canariense]OSI89333.1 methylmalonate-semialdehyde dehydrogenase (CoA acylating) [Bradyrhizobium canariense]OSI93163.1 methylmalonate-semialdehyde dehydrogenase (CoA acylating) [Bradyrhizobium canariense]OSJ03132.1 methylmalonate-se
MSGTILNFINGDVKQSTSGRTSPVFNPATGQQSGSLSLASADDVRAAVAAARAAFPAWANTPPLRRARILNRFLRILEERIDELAGAITDEHGKVLSDAKGEVQRGMEVVEFATGAPQLLKGEITENVGTRVDSHSLRQPLGVVAGITPFNFPAMVPMWMFPVALACGNTFILKPSERDPAASLILAKWLDEAGLPRGVFNVVQGDKEAVDALLTHPDVAAVSFVGSTPVARYIYETATRHGKRCQALGGAKNHMIVMPDADMDQAVDALMGAAYGSAGERCMAISVAVPIGETTAERLIQKLAPKVRALNIGPGTDPEAEMGPLVTRQHLDKVRAYIDAGVAEGAELVVDGRDFRRQGYENGYFIGGTLFDRVTTDMRIYREEIFGPVLAVARASSYDDAAEMINRHEFGNGTAIFTRDGDAAREFAHQIQVGMVGINVPIPVPMAFHSFGGWKASLFGDHHMHGPEGVRFYTKLKTITTRWPTGIRAGAEFVMPTMG